MVLNMFRIDRTTTTTSGPGRIRTWSAWVAVPVCLAVGAVLLAPSPSRASVVRSAIEIAVMLTAPTVLGLVAISSAQRWAPWMAALLGVMPFAAAALVLDRALGVFDSWWLAVHDGALFIEMDVAWFGVGRGPAIAAALGIGVLALLGAQHPTTRAAALLQLGGAGCATALMPWNAGPFEPRLQRLAICAFAASLAVLALATRPDRRVVGVVAGAVPAAAGWVGLPSDVAAVALALVVVAALAVAVWALDRPLASEADRVVAERLLGGAGSLAAAVGGVAGVAALWHRARHRAPGAMRAIVQLQRVSIIGCTLGFVTAVVFSPTVFGGLLVMVGVLAFAAGIGFIYVLGSLVMPFSPLKAAVWDGPADATWMWAFRNRFMQGVQAITFVAVHGFMVWVTRGLWLVPPVVAGLCWLAASLRWSEPRPKQTWPAPHLIQPQPQD
jgi:uncharacterized membrane protein YsdA (DUF1294 family)